MAETTEFITVASLNTQMGRAVREPGGLKRLDGVDVLLMQEVQLDGGELAKRVQKETNLTIGQYDYEFGLALAIHDKYSITRQQAEVLQDRSSFGYLMLRAQDRFNKTQFRLRGRGLVGLTLESPGQNVFTVATTHPTVPLKFRSRNAQVEALAEAVAGIEGRLILAGDMNHWPGPHRIDREMYRAAGLEPIDIPADTFDVSRTKYAWLGRLANIGLNINGQLDAMLYRGDLQPVRTELVDVPSDHRAVVTKFALNP